MMLRINIFVKRKKDLLAGWQKGDTVLEIYCFSSRNVFFQVKDYLVDKQRNGLRFQKHCAQLFPTENNPLSKGNVILYTVFTARGIKSTTQRTVIQNKFYMNTTKFAVTGIKIRSEYDVRNTESFRGNNENLAMMIPTEIINLGGPVHITRHN